MATRAPRWGRGPSDAEGRLGRPEPAELPSVPTAPKRSSGRRDVSRRPTTPAVPHPAAAADWRTGSTLFLVVSDVESPS